MDDVIQGLLILQKYTDKNSITAEHDVIYAGHDCYNVSAVDQVNLEKYYWHWDDEVVSWRIYV